MIGAVLSGSWKSWLRKENTDYWQLDYKMGFDLSISYRYGSITIQ